MKIYTHSQRQCTSLVFHLWRGLGCAFLIDTTGAKDSWPMALEETACVIQSFFFPPRVKLLIRYISSPDKEFYVLLLISPAPTHP